MAGVFFDYTPGRIDARFRHASMSGMIVLRIRMSNAFMTTTESDENWKLGESVNHYQRAVDESMLISSVFCPFRDYIRFLEAVVMQVQECAFEWDAEGPEGRLEWCRRFIDDTGFLTIKWDGWFRGKNHTFSHRMMLNTRQMVRLLYSSFRRFVESDEYDPIRYESMNVGEACLMVLSGSSLIELAEVLVSLDSQRAESLLYEFRKVVGNRHFDGGRLAYPLQHYIDRSYTPVELDEINAWIDQDWGGWQREQRMTYILDSIFKWKGIVGDGSNLRELRSPLIEQWLISPEPPRTSPFGIPHRGEDGTEP